MAISRVSIPTPTAPGALADYQAQNDQLTALNQAFTGRNIVDSSTIHAGTVMMIGGVLYESTTDTTITGTPSRFVKITPSGATAAAAFVASLSGVAWNHAYGGYYDGTGNLYLFDEARAVNEGNISVAYTLQGQIAYLKGGLDINGALSGVTNLAMGGALSGVTSLAMGGSLSGATNISASDDISSAHLHTGDISGTSLGVSGIVSAGGAITGASVAVSGAVSGASGAISGALSGGSVASGSTLSAIGAISGASVAVSGAVSGLDVGASRDLDAGRNIAAIGSVSGASAAFTGVVTSQSVGLAPYPTASGLGQWEFIDTALGSGYTLPSGGSWAYFAIRTTSSDTTTSRVGGIAAGGTAICSALANTRWTGFAWRFA